MYQEWKIMDILVHALKFVSNEIFVIREGYATGWDVSVKKKVI